MRVEVALIISTLPDVPDTEESSRKEKSAEGWEAGLSSLGI